MRLADVSPLSVLVDNEDVMSNLLTRGELIYVLDQAANLLSQLWRHFEIVNRLDVFGGLNHYLIDGFDQNLFFAIKSRVTTT
jgi:hypothetical protein